MLSHFKMKRKDIKNNLSKIRPDLPKDQGSETIMKRDKHIS
jgi:hypothetical protein